MLPGAAGKSGGEESFRKVYKGERRWVSMQLWGGLRQWRESKTTGRDRNYQQRHDEEIARKAAGSVRSVRCLGD